jgi:hypothetical protein
MRLAWNRTCELAAVKQGVKAAPKNNAPMTLERESLTIVLLGDLNPKIFSPVWFERNQLLPSGDTAELG